MLEIFPVTIITSWLFRYVKYSWESTAGMSQWEYLKAILFVGMDVYVSYTISVETKVMSWEE